MKINIFYNKLLRNMKNIVIMIEAGRLLRTIGFRYWLPLRSWTLSEMKVRVAGGTLYKSKSAGSSSGDFELPNRFTKIRQRDIAIFVFRGVLGVFG